MTMSELEKVTAVEHEEYGAAEIQVLEGLEAVEAAEVSHEKGTAVVTLKAEIANGELKKAVEDQGYDVTDIQ